MPTLNKASIIALKRAVEKFAFANLIRGEYLLISCTLGKFALASTNEAVRIVFAKLVLSVSTVMGFLIGSTHVF